jgi:hypothetical protein
MDEKESEMSSDKSDKSENSEATSAAAATKPCRFSVHFDPENVLISFRNAETAFCAVSIYVNSIRHQGQGHGQEQDNVEFLSYASLMSSTSINASDVVRAVRNLYTNYLIDYDVAVACKETAIKKLAKERRRCQPQLSDVFQKAVLGSSQLVDLLDNESSSSSAVTISPEVLEEQWTHSYENSAVRQVAVRLLTQQMDWSLSVFADCSYPLARFVRCFKSVESTDAVPLLTFAVRNYEANLNRAIKISKALKF